MPVPFLRSRHKHAVKLSRCRGFGWDRVNFLSGSWRSAVFRIWDENNVDNTRMFLAVARQSRTFQLLALAWPARCTRGWEGTRPGQLTGAAEGVFHTV